MLSRRDLTGLATPYGCEGKQVLVVRILIAFNDFDVLDGSEKNGAKKLDATNEVTSGRGGLRL